MASISIISDSTVNLISELEQFRPFQNLHPDNRQLLAQGAIRQHLDDTRVILHKGDRVSGAYMVLKGRLRVFSIAPNGTEATLHFVSPGETCVVAMNCLFGDLHYPAWVQAERDSAFAIIPGPLYRRLFETEPQIQNLTINALSMLVQRLMAELEQVHSSHHRQRVAQFILSHADADGMLRITQQQLAHHLGTSREVVARLLQDFVAMGLVKTGRGLLTLRDALGLRRVVAPELKLQAPGNRAA